jgi:bifunctional non-homologous end joining protein LigD
LSEHIEGDGAIAFREFTFGFEGIASKRRDSPFRSGRRPDWLI